MADAPYEKPPAGGCDAWRDGIAIVTNLDVNTTGKHKVWTAARRLRDFLESEAKALKLDRPGLRVLELGAGCGWLGLTVAANLLHCTVVMTEQADGGAVEHISQNIQKNAELVGDRVTACTLDWRDCGIDHNVGETVSSQAARGPPSGAVVVSGGAATIEQDQASALWDQQWDLVIGSDLVYNETGAVLLPQVMRRFADSGALILYGHTLGRFEILDIDFQQNLSKQGLSYCTVVEGGIESLPDPDEEGSLIDLFPELRPVVFRINRVM